MSYSLFLDFDGTTATVDVGNRFFTTFSDGRNIPLVERWLKGEISSIECLREEARLVSADRSKINDFSRQFNIDPGFSDLRNLCARNDIPIYIISDGLDIYIESMMRGHGFEDIPVLANRAVLSNGALEVQFPYLDESCGRCANCKGSAIKRLVRDTDRSIFVGDGYSDLCAIGVADYLFAKADLADYLSRTGKDFVSFDTLTDVTNRIREMIRED